MRGGEALIGGVRTRRVSGEAAIEPQRADPAELSAPIGPRRTGSVSAPDGADGTQTPGRRSLAGVGGASRPRGDWARDKAAAAAARDPSEAGAGCMGRRRRRVDPADAAGALPAAITALSRALPGGPSAETFRRAKFDRPAAVRPAGRRPGLRRPRRREAAGPADRRSLISAGPGALEAALPRALAAAGRRRRRLAHPG